MALMERIIRPHLPVDTTPTKKPTKCFEAQQNTVIKIPAPSGITGYKPAGGGFTTKDPPQTNTQQKTKTSSHMYAYKKYMTKVEREQDKCEDGAGAGQARIVGGQVVEPAAAQGGGGGGGGGAAPPPASGPSEGGGTGGIGHA